MKHGFRGTVRVFPMNELAGKERERLLGALEKFVNVQGSSENYEKFGLQWSSFFPASIDVLEEAYLTDSGIKRVYKFVPEAEDLFRAYVWLLREIWQGNRKLRAFTGVLLGIDDQFVHAAEQGESPFGDPHDRFKEGWRRLRIRYPDTYQSTPVIHPSWASGEFHYTPLNDFQCAVFLLFKESWRAKTCSVCERCFIASKPAQVYCSPSCSGEAKRRRSLLWWHETGKNHRSNQRSVRKARAHKRSHNKQRIN
jgi:hypothetical protein